MSIGLREKRSEPVTLYTPKRKPRPQQVRALEKMHGKRAFALLMAMRCRKTKVVVDDFGALAVNGKVRDLLVIAPGGAYRPWDEAVRLDFPDELMRRTKVFTWISGKAGTKDYEAELASFLSHEGIRVLLVNIEAVSAVRRVRDLCLTFLRQNLGKNMIVCDESVIIKERDSICGKFCVDALAPLAYWRRILTGLISPKSPTDLYAQFRFLDPMILREPFAQFRDRYCVIERICTLPDDVIKRKFKNSFLIKATATAADLQKMAKALWPDEDFDGYSRERLLPSLTFALASTPRKDMVDAIFRIGRYIQSIPVVKGFRNLEELQERIAPHSFRVTLKDCYDEPAASYAFRDVEMTTEQERLYTEIREFATAELEKEVHVTAGTVIVQMLRLHQILCGHTVDEDGVVHVIPENRTRELISLLEDYDGKAIVWCSYDLDVNKVVSALKKAFGRDSVARFWGGNVRTREDEERAFKSDPACRFMVATQAAGGRGRAWHEANLVVYYSQLNNLDHRLQSEERAKAEGKMTPVEYIDLRIPGTVEDRIIGALRSKLDLAVAINADSWRNWLI